MNDSLDAANANAVPVPTKYEYADGHADEYAYEYERTSTRPVSSPARDAWTWRCDALPDESASAWVSTAGDGWGAAFWGSEVRLGLGRMEVQISG